MKQVLILRHAKSDWNDVGLADHDRPLAPRGERDAPRMGRLMRTSDLVPDLILTSSALRARSTAELAVEACGYEGKVRVLPWLYPGDPRVTLEYLGRLPDTLDRVLVVGHNPAQEALLTELTGAVERLPTAALALVGLGVDRWGDMAPGAGVLERLWLPKEIPKSD